ncbi:MAG: hypothetical protein RR454_00345 [Clostridia bacterium]
MKKLYVALTSLNKGKSWTVLCVPGCLGIIAAEDKKTAKAMLFKLYQYLKTIDDTFVEKYFKIVEFAEVEQ